MVDQQITASEGKQESDGRNGKSRMGVLHWIVKVSAVRERGEHSEESAEAQAEEVQNITDENAFSKSCVFPLPLDRPERQGEQVDERWQDQSGEQNKCKRRGKRGDNGRSQCCLGLERLSEQLPASGERRLKSLSIRIVVVDVRKKEASCNQEMAEETKGSEQQREEVLASARGARLILREVGSFTVRFPNGCQRLLSAHAQDGLLMGTQKRQADSQHEAEDGGKAKAKEWNPEQENRQDHIEGQPLIRRDDDGSPGSPIRIEQRRRPEEPGEEEARRKTQSQTDPQANQAHRPHGEPGSKP